MKLEKVENCWCGFEWCILNAQKVLSSNKFKKMKCLCNRLVFVWNPDTSKEIVHCTWSASGFCHNPLNFLAHAMWVKWWYRANFQSFQSSFCSAFQFQGRLAQKISKWMRNSKWSEKGLKIDDVAFNGAYWMHKSSGV